MHVVLKCKECQTNHKIIFTPNNLEDVFDNYNRCTECGHKFHGINKDRIRHTIDYLLETLERPNFDLGVESIDLT